MEGDRMLTVAEAASAMRMSTRYVRRLVAERKIAFHRMGRSIRIAASDVADHVQSGRVEPQTDADIWRDLRGVA